jgi:hypothetical protein
MGCLCVDMADQRSFEVVRPCGDYGLRFGDNTVRIMHKQTDHVSAGNTHFSHHLLRGGRLGGGRADERPV